MQVAFETALVMGAGSVLLFALGFVIGTARGSIGNAARPSKTHGVAAAALASSAGEQGSVATDRSSGASNASSPGTRSGHAELLRAIVDHAPMAVLVYGETGKISFSNREARLLFAEGKALDGQNFLALIGQAPEALRAGLMRPADALFTVDGDSQLETFSLAKRELDVEGEPQTLLMVKELTPELGRQEIDVWKKVIRLINHELNNSLAPILSMVHTARFISSDPQQLHKLERVFETIEERARHLASFLEGYARFARLPRPRPEPVDWSKFLDAMRALYPQVSIGEAPTRVGYADMGQIQQVAINLLKNALEASPDGSPVELSVSVENDGSSTLSVADRGHGMSSEVLKNAMVPFFTTKETGSGLGLALAREILEAHRGKLTILRREGGGIEVVCWLPGKAPLQHSLRQRSPTTTLTLTRS